VTFRADSRAVWPAADDDPSAVERVAAKRAERDADPGRSWLGFPEQALDFIRLFEHSEPKVFVRPIPQPMKHVQLVTGDDGKKSLAVNDAPTGFNTHIGPGSVVALVGCLRMLPTSGMGDPIQVYFIPKETLLARAANNGLHKSQIQSSSIAVADLNRFM